MPRAARSDAAGRPDQRDPAEAAIAACEAAAEENRRLTMKLRADPRNQDAVSALVISAGALSESRAELTRIRTDERALAEAVKAGVAIGRARRLTGRQGVTAAPARITAG